ncbi:unnamed protein product [Cylindrotheca closterium]|uniref:Uncharacterized protein n=1 Tax=Cylindrotheca closterium TaxID=2856 RepID=A0AAD2FSI1_9STRA|nr:unnamed protein product [Cylindrotheca closterium]
MANRTKTGNYMEANFQAHPLETGTSFGILQQVDNNTAILASDTWMKRVWHELEGLDATPQPYHITVCTVSDIVTADGGLFVVLLGMESGMSAAAGHTNGQGPFAQSANTGTCGRPLYPEPCLPPMGHITHYDIHLVTGLILWRTGIGCCHPIQASSTALGQPGDIFLLGVLPPRHVALHHCLHLPPIRGTGRPLEMAPTTSPSILQAWQTAAELCTDYYGWVPDKIEIHDDKATLVAALLEGHLRVISNGSFKNKLGTAALQLLVKHGGSDRITIRCQTLGLPQDQSPYRSEVIGLMASIMAIYWLLQQWAPNLLTCPRARIACDGLSAIEMTFEDRLLSPTDAQFDLVSSIPEAILRSSVGKLSSGPLLIGCPSMCMAISKSLIYLTNCLGGRKGILKSMEWRFTWQTPNSHVLILSFIQECITLPALCLRWRDNGTISAEAKSEIAWDTLGRAMQSLPAGLQRRL